ncbi:MAG: ABC transporter permease [Bacteroidales bacterium]|nr:ABC transporter permease [Bacteroidales bacterium]
MNRLINNLHDIWDVFSAEVRRVFTDRMVMLVFFVATVLYPIVFCFVYRNEAVVSLPVAVVDQAQCELSKRYIHKLDATPELHVAYKCATLEEARHLMRSHDVHAVFYFPKDFSSRLAEMRTARVALFCDMSSFLYYKNALLGGNNVLIDEMHTIELERYAMTGLTGQQATEMIQPVVYDDVKLYNPSMGFASFFLPALLMIVIHQTLFIGITIMCGDASENRRALHLIPPRLRTRSTYRVTIGRALCFILIYIPITLLDLWLIPRWFALPQLGNLRTLIAFLLPFVLAVTFFGMTFGNLFVRQKMSGVLCCVFFSVLLFFLSGIVWPQSNMPRFWLAFSYLFPSTPGIQGYVRISSMGAALAEVRHEYLALWIQAAFYFVTATLSLQFIRKFKPYNAR